MSQTQKIRIATVIVTAALCGLAPGLAVADFYEDALSRFRDSDYKGAIVTLKNALQAEPDNLPALVLMGQALLEVGNATAAEETLRRARNAGADNAIILVPLGEALLAQRKYQTLLSEFSSAGQPKALQVQILVLKGNALFALNRLDEAREMFTQAKTLDPFNANPRVGIARLSLAARHPGIAAAHSAKAVQLDPKNEDAWYINGEAQRLQGDLDAAVKSYSRAVALEPRHEGARMARAVMLVDLKRESEALADIEFVHERNPQQPQASYLKALLLSREGKLDEATAVLSATAALLEGAAPEVLNESAPLLLLAGVIANAQGNDEKALDKLQRFLEMEPDHVLARRMLGTVLVRQGEGRLAVRALEPALRQASKDPLLNATLGVAYRQAQLYDKSVSALARAVELAPDAPRLRIELARSRLAAGQRLTAASELEAILMGGGESAAVAGSLLTQMRLQQGDVEGALAAARVAAKDNPQNLQAQLALADSLARTGDAIAAGETYEQAMAIDAQSLPAQYGMANAELLQGRLEAAEVRYEAILVRDPGQLPAMLGLAMVAQAEGRFTDATRWLEKARAADGTAVNPQLALVALLLKQGATEKALRAATQLADSAPEDVRAIQALAGAQAASGNREGAKNSYRRTRSMPQASAEQLTAIARGQLAIEDLEGARKSLAKANARDPDHLPSQAASIALDVHEKRFEEAIARARLVRKRHPNRGVGPMLVGDVLSATKRYDLAIAAFEEAISREPLPAAKVKLFQARWRAGRHAEAIAGINTWLAAEPDNPLALRQLAEAYLSDGRLEEAQGLHERLVAVLADDADLLNNLAWLYQTRGDSRALATAKRAVALAPEQSSTLDTYGWILLESGQPEEALKILRKAQVRAAKNPWVRFHTALALSRLGRNDEARELLLELLASSIPFENAKEARALLDRLSKG